MIEGQSQPVRVLLTRSRAGNEELAKHVREVGMTPVLFNALEFAPPDSWDEVDSALKELGGFDWAVFTSATGVSYVMERASTVGVRFDGVSIAAVGERTADTLRHYGYEPDFVPSEFTTKRLGMELPQGGKRVLLFRAQVARNEIVEILRRRGFDVRNVTAYRTIEGGRKSDEIAQVDVVAFASPSAVRAVCMSLSEENLSHLRAKAVAACIGPVTAEAAKRAGFRVLRLPRSFTTAGLLEVIRCGID